MVYKLLMPGSALQTLICPLRAFRGRTSVEAFRDGWDRFIHQLNGLPGIQIAVLFSIYYLQCSRLA